MYVLNIYLFETVRGWSTFQYQIWDTIVRQDVILWTTTATVSLVYL